MKMEGYKLFLSISPSIWHISAVWQLTEQSELKSYFGKTEDIADAWQRWIQHTHRFPPLWWPERTWTVRLMKYSGLVEMKGSILNKVVGTCFWLFILKQFSFCYFICKSSMLDSTVLPVPTVTVLEIEKHKNVKYDLLLPKLSWTKF